MRDGRRGENRALEVAEEKGRQAHMAGDPITACPYPDKRTSHGSVTYSRAYIRAWEKGWRYADETVAEIGSEMA